MIFKGDFIFVCYEIRLYLLDYEVKSARFKIPRRSRCVGSSPTPGTIGIKAE